MGEYKSKREQADPPGSLRKHLGNISVPKYEVQF
jgi:hypothetical protein